MVLLEWRGNFLLHLVKEIKDDQLLIGNNLGKTNGWVNAAALEGWSDPPIFHLKPGELREILIARNDDHTQFECRGRYPKVALIRTRGVLAETT